MNINFELYRIFFVVAECQNITKAAERLHISQPAISKSIKNLEEQLGGQLFIRTKRGVSLTEEGKEFYRYIKQAMEFITNAEHKFNDLIHLETGSIRIGVSTTLTKQFLLPYLKSFHEQFPHVNIQIATNISSDLFKMLREGLLDVIILNLPGPTASDIEVIPIKVVHDCLIVGQTYQELSHGIHTMEELLSYPFIVQSPGSTARGSFDSFCHSNHITITPAMNLSSYTLVLEFTKIGFGIGYATKEFIEQELQKKELFILKTKEEHPKRHIGLAYSKKSLPSFATRKFMDIILMQKKDSQ